MQRANFFDSVYNSFPRNFKVLVNISENIEKEKWSEYNSEYDLDQKVAYATDPFFSHTEFSLSGDLKYLFLKLDIEHLVLISNNLPKYLSDISQNQQTSVKEKIIKATKYINNTYGKQGWIWRTRKVDWDLSYLPFFLHFWSKPHLVEQGITFGLARNRFLHSNIIDLHSEKLQKIKNSHKISNFFELARVIFQLALYLFGYAALNISHDQMKKEIIILEEEEEKRLDLKALELSNHSEGALHYLKSIQANFEAQTKAINSKPIDRVTALESVIEQNEEQLKRQNAKKDIHSPKMVFWNGIKKFFTRIYEFFVRLFCCFKHSV